MRSLNDVGITVLLENSLGADISVLGEVHKEIFHTLVETKSNYDFIGLYGKKFKVLFLNQEDIVKEIQNITKKFGGTRIVNLKVKPIDEVFNGSEISRGYDLFFQVLE